MENCNNCTKKQAEPVPYQVYELEVAKHERTERRFCIAICVSAIINIIVIAALVIQSLYWADKWSSYDYIGEDIEITASDGIANYIGEDGVINNGTNPSS